MQHQAANIELKKFQNREGPFSKKLARTFENFDYNPGRGTSYKLAWLMAVCCLLFSKLIEVFFFISALWWRLYGYETPALQKMATRILSLTSSSSGCERNWSRFEGVSTYLL